MMLFDFGEALPHQWTAAGDGWSGHGDLICVDASVGRDADEVHRPGVCAQQPQAQPRAPTWQNSHSCKQRTMVVITCGDALKHAHTRLKHTCAYTTLLRKHVTHYFSTDSTSNARRRR